MGGSNVSFCLVKHVIYFSLRAATGRKYICNYPHSRQVGLMEKPLAEGGWMEGNGGRREGGGSGRQHNQQILVVNSAYYESVCC